MPAVPRSGCCEDSGKFEIDEARTRDLPGESRFYERIRRMRERMGRETLRSRVLSRCGVHVEYCDTVRRWQSVIGHREIAIHLVRDAGTRNVLRVLARTRAISGTVLVAMWSLFQCHRISWTTPPARTWWCGRAATWRYDARRQEHRSRRSRGVARRAARSACQTGTKVCIFALLLLLLLRRTSTGYILSRSYRRFAIPDRVAVPFPFSPVSAPLFNPISSLSRFISRILNVIRSRNVCAARLSLVRAKIEWRKVASFRADWTERLL